MLSLTPNLQNKEISIRPLVQTDFDGLFACAGNKEVWAGHPNSDRYKRKNFEKWFLDAINSGSGLTVIDNKTEKIIGSTRFYFEATSNDAIAIGFTFLACEYWGGETNYQLKSLMFDYAFTAYSSVWMHISPLNIRSQKATLKLGAEYVRDDVVCLGANEPTLWQFYKITRNRWLEIKNERELLMSQVKPTNFACCFANKHLV